MRLLDVTPRSYAWGSTTDIPQLLGVAPTGEPQAELWLGCHPADPARVPGGGTLLECIDTDPQSELGPAVIREYGPRLPFLLKVLAAGAPLSLQAHPSSAQARAGYEEEERRGVPLDAPERRYKDPYAKPELLCALTTFEVLAGFRPPADTVRLLEALDVPELKPFVETLRAADGPRETFTALLTLPDDARRELVHAVVTACTALSGGTRGAEPPVREFTTVVELAAAYPEDIGVVASLLLHRLTLQPGEAIYLPTGNLHSYLRGMGVEIMGNSDNVLRGGLTAKHVDVPELLRVLDFSAAPLPVVVPERHGGEEVYPTPAREFRLSRLRVPASPPTVLGNGLPQVLLCASGEVILHAGDEELLLQQGRAAFVAAQEPPVRVTGHGQVFRATPGPT
jgi:mannose-6-phosphate isomerase